MVMVTIAPSEIDPYEPDAKGFLFDEFTRVINRSNSRRVVAILDCCYSGSADLGKGGDAEAANLGREAIESASNRLEQGEGKYILASAYG